MLLKVFMFAPACILMGIFLVVVRWKLHHRTKETKEEDPLKTRYKVFFGEIKTGGGSKK